MSEMRDTREGSRDSEQQFRRCVQRGEQPGRHWNRRDQRHHLAMWKQQRISEQQTEHPAILHFTDLILEAGPHLVRRGQRIVSLTHLEFNLLQEFLKHPQQVLSKEVLLDRVWDYDFGGNANVVEVYVKQLRQKLEENGEARLIQTVRGVGYTLREEE